MGLINMLELDSLLYFLLGVLLVGVPAFVFYRIGMDIGVNKGVRKQLLRELMANGILEEADMSVRSSHRH